MSDVKVQIIAQATIGAITVYGCVDHATGQVYLLSSSGRNRPIGVRAAKEPVTLALRAKGGLFELVTTENGQEATYLLDPTLSVVAYSEQPSTWGSQREPQRETSHSSGNDTCGPSPRETAMAQVLNEQGELLEELAERVYRLEQLHPEIVDS